MQRPDPIYWLIYLYVLAAASILVWEFLPTTRARRSRSKNRSKRAVARTKR